MNPRSSPRSGVSSGKATGLAMLGCIGTDLTGTSLIGGDLLVTPGDAVSCQLPGTCDENTKKPHATHI
jgi:hypothetical protein